MNSLYAYVPVLLAFLTVACYSWVFGGINTPALAPLTPWMLIFSLEALFFFQERHPGESSTDARVRSGRGLRRDPLTYLALSFVFILIIPLFNHGLCRLCDYPKIMAGADPEPLCTFLPFCVNTTEHLSVIMWIVPTFAAVLAVRHALTDTGKRAFFHLLVWNATALAVLGFVQMMVGAPGPLGHVFGSAKAPHPFFSVFSYPNMAGCFFTAAYAASVGYWYHHWRETDRETAEIRRQPGLEKSSKVRYRWVVAHYPAVAVVLNFFAALASLSRAAILLTFVVTFFWFVYIALATFTHREKDAARRVRSGSIALVAFVALVLSTAIFAPAAYRREVGTLSPGTIFERVSGDGEYHMRVAGAIFRDHPLFGVGGWGYRHFALEYMTPNEAESIQTTGAANVHNDSLQLLTEHGLVGAGLFFAFVIILFVPFLRVGRLVLRKEHFSKRHALPRPNVLFAVPAPVVGAIVAALAAFVHSLGDCPFRSPAVLSMVLLLLASARGYLKEE